VAIAVNGEGYREILGICEGAKEDKAGWSAFLSHLVFHLREPHEAVAWCEPRELYGRIRVDVGVFADIERAREACETDARSAA
jgi:hypothetical protein